jgi:transcriptional regulator with GAF, ATPase, and Fis domain
VVDGARTARAAPPAAADVVDQRAQIVDLLARHRGNLAAVARALRTSRSQVYRLMERHGIRRIQLGRPELGV